MIDYLLISTEIQIILFQSASWKSNKEGKWYTQGKTSKKSKEILQRGINRVRREIQRKKKANYKEPKKKKTRSQETDPIVKAERDKDFIWRWKIMKKDDIGNMGGVRLTRTSLHFSFVLWGRLTSGLCLYWTNDCFSLNVSGKIQYLPVKELNKTHIHHHLKTISNGSRS